MPSAKAITKCFGVFSSGGTGTPWRLVPERGHTGEEAWTIMTMDGEEVLSSVVHILGFFVGYMGYNSHKRTTNDKCNNYADFDMGIKNLLPCFMKAKCV